MSDEKTVLSFEILGPGPRWLTLLILALEDLKPGEAVEFPAENGRVRVVRGANYFIAFEAGFGPHTFENGAHAASFYLGLSESAAEDRLLQPTKAERVFLCMN